MSLAIIITKVGWKPVSSMVKLEPYQRLKVDYMVNQARETGCHGLIVKL